MQMWRLLLCVCVRARVRACLSVRRRCCAEWTDDDHGTLRTAGVRTKPSMQRVLLCPFLQVLSLITDFAQGCPVGGARPAHADARTKRRKHPSREVKHAGHEQPQRPQMRPQARQENKYNHEFAKDNAEKLICKTLYSWLPIWSETYTLG
eukprot:2097433-Amphidinium_carterae.1